MYISLFLILQDKAKMEAYAQSKGWTTFDLEPINKRKNG
jgi:hypothetical protein